MAKKPVKSVNLLPDILRTDKNSKFLSSTIDQLIQPPELERLDGFIGSKFTPTYISTSDVYISETLPLRRNYQLEPALIIKDSLGDIEKTNAIDDLANEITSEGGFNNNFDRLFKSDIYSYNPHIDLDKFVNFQKYYWLTTGPQTISISGQQVNSTSTYTVKDNEIKSAWVFSPDGFSEDPDITLYRGSTYRFEIKSDYKFYIKTAPSLGTDDIYDFGVTDNGTASGTIIFTVTENTPQTLYYTSDNVNFVQGKFIIKTITDDSVIDVEKEVIGKKNYTSGAGIELSNGMKIRFQGNVTPSFYQDKEFFVEGVGSAITLIDYSLLTGSEKLAAQFDDDFDVTNFDEYPFDSFKQLPLIPEYITINRASRDLNPWTRYNRWVHEDIIKISAELNNTEPVYPVDKRARRPIIEFVPNLQLYNFGSIGIKNIDLIDNDTIDAFSVVEGSTGYYVDGVLLQQGHRIVFNADNDPLVRGKIYQVNFLIVEGNKKLQLLETDDHNPVIGASLSTNLGNTTSGKSYYWNGTVWALAQQHEKINQAPLFDLFDSNGVSYSSENYDTDFSGSKIFSYEIGSGENDSVLGFPLSYQNTVNVGSYLFRNHFTSDVITFYENNKLTTSTTALSYLKINNKFNTSYTNVWSLSYPYQIPILQQNVITDADNPFVDIISVNDPLGSNIKVDVFADQKKIPEEEVFFNTLPGTLQIGFDNPLPVGTNVLLKIYTDSTVNDNGQYEVPISLTNNPLNGPIELLTLTEISDHYKTMVDRMPDFVGEVFGSNNSRDLSDLTKYGTRLVSNGNPISFSNFFLGIKEHDVVDAIQKSADQYNQFKFNLLKKTNEIGNTPDPVSALNQIMASLNADKDLNSPWYYTDMLPYGDDKIVRNWTITDLRNTVYPITNDFNPNELSFRSVLVYLNNRQLILDKDYKFLINDASVELLTEFQVGDTLRIDDYTNTEGCYVPSTPSKLGLYPKFEPKIYIDDTYLQPTKVIQGHDGSIMVAYDDYRDEIILEFEKRIFNNIKVTYRHELIDINRILVGAFRSSQYSAEEINIILLRDFIRWTGANNIDYITNSTFLYENSFSWNYSQGKILNLDKTVSGYWRNIFKFLYDTDRPHTHPWEMLGFTQQPDWWESEYGPAPYTAGNSILWEDLELGYIKQGPRQGYHKLYTRQGLSQILPVDDFGKLKDPSTFVVNTLPSTIRSNWIFGDHGPAETTWKKSSFYPFAIQRLLALTMPSLYCAYMYDPASINKNIAGQWTYGNSYEFLNPKKIKVYSENGIQTSGYSVYVVEIGKQRTADYISILKNNLKYLDFNLFHKVGGFISKNKIQIIIDAIDPSSVSPGAILPQESYKLILNTSNPIKTSTISGIIIQKSNGKFVVKGYDLANPYFKIFSPRRNSTTPAITIGGVSESFVVWDSNRDGGETGLTTSELATAQSSSTGNFYRKGQIVLYNQRYYRTIVSHRSGEQFIASNFQSLPSLPIIGGVSVQTASMWTDNDVIIQYGTEFDNIQDLYDMIVGYGKFLESQGFVFDEYNQDLNELMDWNLSAKEFIYWTTQNWAENSIITLSPFANKVKFNSQDSIVDNLFNNFYDYGVLKADGLPLRPENLNITRNDSLCSVETIGTTEGIYYLELRSVQKEHAIVFDNTTIFNDTIYETETGYRQRRMKLKGFRTKNWNGDYFSPGFVYDSAKINEWKKFTTYIYGDTIRYGGNYYSAKRNVVGSDKFDFNDWVLLNEKPVPDLIPNFEYKINQFEDFYSLDIDNFDVAQQKMAQHLIGYTPRVYLDNIFTNPISQYKFYQGFIKEKGTKNAISKMAKASIFNLQGEISFTEEWALRLGQFGSFTSYEELEIKLHEGTFIENPQIVNFVDAKPNNPIDLIYYNTLSNITIVPEDFNSETVFATISSDNFRLPNAGYVNFEDITATAYNENSLLDIANTQDIKNGDVFWLGFKSNGDWDVLRYSILESRVVGVFVSSPGIDITFVTDLFHGLSKNDIVTIIGFNDQVNGVYRVKSIPKLNQFTVESTLATIVNEPLLSPGLLYKFQSVRYSSFDNLPNDSEMLKLPVDTKFWVDNQMIDGTFDWKVYNKIENFGKNQIISGINNSGQKFSYALYKDNTDVILVGSPGFSNVADNGRVYVFLKNNNTANRLIAFTFNKTLNQFHSSSSSTGFGSSLSYSSKKMPGSNYGLFFVGAPEISNVLYTGTNIKVASESGINNNIFNGGAVKVASLKSNLVEENNEILILSPAQLSNEYFGTSLSYNAETNNLLIGAPGTQNTVTASIYQFQILTPDLSLEAISTATSGTNLIYVSSTASIKLGQTITIPGILPNVIGGYIVTTIVDDGVSRFISLDQNLPTDIPNQSTLNFYSTSTLLTSNGLYTSTNGVFVSFVNTITSAIITTGTEYGYSIDVSTDGKYTVVSAPGADYVETFIDIGKPSQIRAVHSSTIGTGIRFGESVALSKGGEYLFVGAPNVKNADDSFGQVIIYKRIGNTFTQFSSLSNPVAGAALNFGREIVINESTDTLAISAIGLNKNLDVQFDNNETIFDSGSTTFSGIIEDFGTVYVYNKLENGNRFVLTSEILPDLTLQNAGSNFGHSLAIDTDTIFVGAPSLNTISTSSFWQFTKLDSNKNTLDLYRQKDTVVDIETIQKIRTIDTFNETVVEYLDVIDPIKGKISGLAEQELKYKSAYDPAVYSIGTAGVVVDAETSWLDERVGELWWDLSTVKYIWYEQSDLVYRKNNWGSLFPGATIDVYEWVSSPYLPSEWLALADTSEGLTEGISGQPKYTDNSCIAVKQIYNSVSNSFSNVYYYWVKNKVTVPDSKNRRISSYQVANLIADPTTYGLKYAAIIDSNSIALANVGATLVGDRISLNISYDKTKNNIAKHTEWFLIEEGSANSVPPKQYEQKLFDSLLGRDSLGNLVPDPGLSDRMKYGVGIRPRQTMFKNRKEALRTLIEFTNDILIKNQITDVYSFRNLNQQELPPDESLNEYDFITEDNEGLNLIDTRLLDNAELSCTVQNGRIRSVTVVKSGFGYLKPPTVTIQNVGTGAIIKTKIDSNGRVISAEIENAGRNYIQPPSLIVRPFTVLVLADNFYNNKWTKFEWNKDNKEWIRKQTQKYNTTLYWNYIDWKAESYNQFVDYTFTVDQVYQLDTLENLIPGQYVKIKNIGDGRYVIVEKANDGQLGTFGKGFNLVYSENGTIQISDKIWNLINSDLGFDQNNTFDQTLYDQTPDLELGFILRALKEDIFVNELKVNWNLFFFKAIKYALTEQKLLDWAFKTSFINVKNIAGLLDQNPVYKFRSTENYESYLKEVKPYHSQIRTFTANHQIYEPSNSHFTDFDLPSYYNTSDDKFEVLLPGDGLLQEQPYKDWNDNYLCKVGNIIVGDGGSGYIFPPIVEIHTAPGDYGSGATAKAYITSGKVSKIEIINPGSNYKIVPTVLLIGGGNINLVPAKAVAQLTNEKVRVNHTRIKFDRISKSPTIVNNTASDSFICNGSENSYVLTWYADQDKSKVTVKLDGDLVLGSEYRLENYTKLYNNYNKKFTRIVFVNFVPSYGQILEVEYKKNIDLYDATERIVEFYNPKTGMPGNELPQLMTGIEYPGVTIQGLPFDYTTDWDIAYSPFGKSLYADDIGIYFKAELTTGTNIGTDTVIVNTTTGIVVGQIVNLLSASKQQSTSSLFATQLIDPNVDVKVVSIDTATKRIKFNSTITEAITATTYQVYRNNDVSTITNFASVEFWSYDSNSSILDSAIEGGTWSTVSNILINGLGINPEDIIINGDGFLTPNTSYAPEEFIPGESHDSVGINVYTRVNEGAPIIYNGTIDIYSNQITTATLAFLPPNLASIFVTYNGKSFSYTEGDVHLAETSYDYTLYNLDWTTGKITIGKQTTQGKMGYTIVGIGGGRSNLEAGVIDRDVVVVNDGSTEAELRSFSSTSTVKSAYVSVNGIAVPQLANINTTTLGFSFITSLSDPKRAAVKVMNLSTSTTSTVQAWFFGTQNKYFNEFKEQIFDVGNPTDTFIIDQPPGIIEPAAGNIIVEIDQGNGYIRLQPPFISYYKVDPSVLSYKVDNNIQRPSGAFIVNNVRVYLNGSILNYPVDWSFNFTSQLVTIRPNLLQEGDVLAILGIPVFGGPSASYDIVGNTLKLSAPVVDCLLKVTTFTNHDDMLVRTESFIGNLNRRFKVSRRIINSNYLWVTVNGSLLINSIDYTVLDDGFTVELSDKWHPTQSDTIVITTISSDKIYNYTLGYRIFNDIFRRAHYKRLSAKNSSVLTKPLSLDDNEIHVLDGSVFTPPLKSKNIPGCVFINGERIEFNLLDGNVLKQIKRGTLGTGVSYYLPEGAKVLDHSISQNIPFNDIFHKQVILTTSTNDTYQISAIDFVSTVSINGDQLISDGIILSTTSTINPIDQIEVYYGGRKLRKDSMFFQDVSLSFDSPEFEIRGTTSSVSLLPSTDVLNTAYIVTSTNEVWVYTGSLEKDSVNGYVYKGFKYLEPEFSVTVAINTSTASVYATTATMYSSTSTQDLSFDIDGSGLVTLNDANMYTRLANGQYVDGINQNSNYRNLLIQNIKLNIDGGVKDNIRLVIVKKEFEKDNIWNDQISLTQTKSILDSSTMPARFLQFRPASLPDELYYYGGKPPLDINSGLALTDENDEPLEGL